MKLYVKHTDSKKKKHGHRGWKILDISSPSQTWHLETSMDHALQHQHLGNAAGGVAEPLGLSSPWCGGG